MCCSALQFASTLPLHAGPTGAWAFTGAGDQGAVKPEPFGAAKAEPFGAAPVKSEAVAGEGAVSATAVGNSSCTIARIRELTCRFASARNILQDGELR